MLHEPEDPEGRGLVSTIQLPSSRNGYYYSSIQKNRQVIESDLGFKDRLWFRMRRRLCDDLCSEPT